MLACRIWVLPSNPEQTIEVNITEIKLQKTGLLGPKEKLNKTAKWKRKTDRQKERQKHRKNKSKSSHKLKHLRSSFLSVLYWFYPSIWLDRIRMRWEHKTPWKSESSAHYNQQRELGNSCHVRLRRMKEPDTRSKTETNMIRINWILAEEHVLFSLNDTFQLQHFLSIKASWHETQWV